MRYRCLALVFFCTIPALGQQPAFDYQDLPVRDVIQRIEARTAYRFLYRDALVSGHRMTLQASEVEVIGQFLERLEQLGIGAKVDGERLQILLFSAPRRARQRALEGYVVDAVTGSRLPFAAVTWEEEGRLHGVVSNEAGFFRMDIPADDIILTASYVGYRRQEVAIGAVGAADHEVTFRLRPEAIVAQEVVVTGVGSAGRDESAPSVMMEPMLSAVGEAGLLRMLQALPSISTAASAMSGFAVRGGSSGAYSVLLDGLPVYNRAHLLGLFDAFNVDAVSAVAFHPTAAPAHVASSPGGTLSLITRTGSQYGRRGEVAVSSVAGRGTVEVPLSNGAGSLLISYRRSLFDTPFWPNYDRLIAWTLDIDRPGSPLPPGTTDLSGRTYVLGEVSAGFFDLHAKIHHEMRSGSRLIFSTYQGGDETSTSGERYMSVGGNPAWHPVRTTNAWGHRGVALDFDHRTRAGLFASSRVGLSRYNAAFDRDDYLYVRALRGGVISHVYAPFGQNNVLHSLHLGQDLTLARSRSVQTAGVSVQMFSLTYDETSRRRPTVRHRDNAVLTDFFLHFDGNVSDDSELSAGIRTHFYSAGPQVRLSPRISIKTTLDPKLAFYAGFGREYQFTHQLNLPEVAAAGAWVLSTADQPPTRGDQVYAGIAVTLVPSSLIRLEVFRSRSANVRHHEIELSSLTTSGSVLLDPWLHGHQGRAGGAEVVARQAIPKGAITATYTVSRADVRHAEILDGEWYPANDDRRHQGRVLLESGPWRGWSLFSAWTMAGGAPNRLAFTDPNEPARLQPVARLDGGISYRANPGGRQMTAVLSLYNVLNRANVWYRTPVSVIDDAVRPRRLDFHNVDVFDLGWRPSFEIRITL
jgi:hypothetical protein